MTDQEIEEYLRLAMTGENGPAYLRQRLCKWFTRDGLVAGIQSDNDE